MPADVLLVAGGCIVNEAMLTGEAIPQMKEAVSPEHDDTSLGHAPNTRLHLLFGGTEVVQVTPPPKDFPGMTASVFLRMQTTPFGSHFTHMRQYAHACVIFNRCVGLTVPVRPSMCESCGDLCPSKVSDACHLRLGVQACGPQNRRV